MRNHFPDPAKEILNSSSRIGKEMRENSGACWIDSGMNKITGGLVAAGREAMTFPLRALVFPTMKTVNDLAKSTVKVAVKITWNAIKSIPLIPVPAKGPERS